MSATYRWVRPKEDRTIYFIRPVGMPTAPVKIGWSRWPPERLDYFQAYSPYPLEIIHSFEGNIDCERALHKRFASSRSHREWFRSSPELVAVIEALKAGASFDEAMSQPSTQKAA